MVHRGLFFAFIHFKVQLTGRTFLKIANLNRGSKPKRPSNNNFRGLYPPF